MKTLIRCIQTLLFAGLIAFLLMAGINVANAQSRDRGGRVVQPGAVKKLPKGHKTVHVNGDRYYYSRGAFYGKSKRGFAIVNAPIGAVVNRLPKNRQIVWIGGQKYFRHKGVLYVKVRRGFKVVSFPWHFATSWNGIGIGGAFFFPGFAYQYSPVHKTYRFAVAKKQARRMNAKKQRARQKNRRGVGKANTERRQVALNRQARGRTGGRRSN